MRATLWNSVRGYVKIKLEGFSLERLLNLARREGVVLRDVCRIEEGAMTARISVEDFRKLRLLQRSVRFRVHIEEKRGLPFRLSVFRRRPMLLFGGVVALFALWAASLFLWEIRIDGCLYTDAEQVKASLCAQGVVPGVRKKGVDPAALSSRIVIDCEGVAWAGVTLEGSRVCVEIIEESAAPEFLDESEPRDIVASKDAILHSLDVFAGTAVKEEGQKVLGGELLVSGFRDGNGATGETLPVRARAEAFGRVWYTGRAEAASQGVEKQRTGRTEEVLTVTIGSIEASAPCTFSEFDAERIISHSVEGFFLPFSVAKEVRREVKAQKVGRTQEEMRRQAGEAAWVKAAAHIPEDARILDSTVTYTDTERGVGAVAVIETLEQIGKSVPRRESMQTEQSNKTP